MLANQLLGPIRIATAQRVQNAVMVLLRLGKPVLAPFAKEVASNAMPTA
jgi:hypothetical protein